MSRRAIQRRLACVLGTSVGLASLGVAQTTLYTFNGDKANDRLGAAVASAGDVNNDGFDDVLVGAPENFNVFLTGEGYVRVYSGQNGSVLATLDGVNLQDAFGHAVSGLGDVNGDGHDDFLVGARLYSVGINQRGMVRVISGATFTPLYDVVGATMGEQLGYSVSGCGDVNGDGIPDFVAGAPFANNNQGLVRVYSGVDGSVIHTFTGAAANGRLGYSCGQLGDVNNDGRADVLVGSLFDGVYVISGMAGTQLQHWTSLVSNDIYGKSVAGIDDMNGDGKRDVLIGATQESVLGTPGPGYVHVRSGATGTVLLTLTGANINDRFGNAVSSARDWNGDTKPDILVGSFPTSPSLDEVTEIRSGVDGSVLATFTGDAAGDGMGYSVAGLGDINGDGKVDVVCGAPDTQPNGIGSGRARVFSSPTAACGGMSTYCTAAPNSAGAGMHITGVGSPSVSAPFFLTVAGGPANQPGLFFYGPNQVSVPFGNGFRCIGGTLVRLNVQALSAGGSANRLLDFPNLPVPITANSTWNFQFWYRDPAGGGAFYNLSDGLHVSFCP
ncbi:MAG: FG-GAP repeat protein [Planctomycetes bacterium]|nr:FG-GAP repeat protein [Planctomycetota bacterium]